MLTKGTLHGAVLMGVIVIGWSAAQTSPAVKTQLPAVVNPGTAKWEHGARDPEGVESVMLREDDKTGAMELLARYPAGHVFPPHWHDSNERIVLSEGRLQLNAGAEPRYLEPGGFAFLPARQVQTMACVSVTRCSFYVFWDGNPASHTVSATGAPGVPAR